MVVGFVLINISPLYEYEVFNALSTLPEIIEYHPLFGEYDLIAKIEAKDYESIRDIILQKIKTIKSITDITSLTGIEMH